MKVREAKFNDCNDLTGRPNETDICHLALTAIDPEESSVAQAIYH